MVNFANLNPFAGSSATTEIADLRIYPVKSCRGISLNSVNLTKQGLDLDRNWMLVDKTDNKFITIRDISELTLIDTALVGPQGDETLELSIRGTDSKISVPARPTQEWLDENTSLSPVEIWGRGTDGYIYNDEFNAIFKEYFKRDVALVRKGPTARMMIGSGGPQYIGREQDVNFPDFACLQIANNASIQELNHRLKEKGVGEITIERFRPNIIVQGASESDESEARPKAWSEDSWKTVRITTGDAQAQSSGILASINPFGNSGQIDIDVAARCARCQVPNVDPETAYKHPKEPWNTLMSYRRVDEGAKYKPCFGMLSVPRQEGHISVGMKFEVLELTNNHKFDRGM